jgi:hypothetical protein
VNARKITSYSMSNRGRAQLIDARVTAACL